MSSTVIKKSIALSVDVSVDVQSTLTNQRGRTRPSRKRRQVVKTQYSYSDSDISEDDERREESITKLTKTTTSTTKARPNNNNNKNNYHQRSSYNNRRSRNMECLKRQERQLMRHWLVDQVNQGDIPGLEWLNSSRATDKTLIKIPWTHASRHGWDVTRDSDLFRRWAIHTGKYSSDPKDVNEDGNPKKWKANFRCAMNSLPDIREVKDMSQKKGTDAYKVYRLLEEKPRGQCRKKSRPNSESSDSDQHYNKYVTKADRLERHKTVKERVRQAIHDKQHMVKHDKEPALPIFEDNMNHHYGNRGGEIPLAVSIATTTAATITTRTQQHQQQPFYSNGCHGQLYMFSDSDGGNSPIKRPRTLPVDPQDLSTRKHPYMMTQPVDKEVEISTSFTEMDIFNGIQRHEHSYAVNMMTDRTIPSLVADFETEPDSDYGSTSPTSSQGNPRENQEERIAQCISDMENDYNNSSTMFSPSTPNMNQEPMFCNTYSPGVHLDPRNNIYKRSESMELYSVPGSAFDQSFPMTGDMSTGTPMQMDNEAAMDRSLQFSEI